MTIAKTILLRILSSILINKGFQEQVETALAWDPALTFAAGASVLLQLTTAEA